MDIAVYQRLVAFSSNSDLTPSQIATMPWDDYFLNSQVATYLSDHKISGMIRGYPGYHRRLSMCKPQPNIIYYQGDLTVLDNPTLSIVGPRLPSHYAVEAVKELVSELRGSQVTTISGGAKGIDRVVHECSVQFGIPTVVVLGGGLQYYHRDPLYGLLQKVIATGGLVLSQRKLMMEPTYYTFPQRNILIAGLGDTLFVSPAGTKSGSLLTVDFALDMNRVVHTIPTSISDPKGAGTNNYIAQQKVQVVTDIKDFVGDLFGQGAQQPVHKISSLTIEQQRVFQDILHEERTFNELLVSTQYPAATLLVLLTELEQYGIIKEIRPSSYVHC